MSSTAKLTAEQIENLAKEIREFLLEHGLWQDVDIYFNGKRFTQHDPVTGKYYYNDREHLIEEENQADSFKDSLESYYEDFDIDEHIEMWIEAKRSGTSGVPSTRELVKDAEAIDGMILELSQALQKVNIPVLVGSYTPPDENGEGEKIVREFYG